jgi:hypothetical protein
MSPDSVVSFRYIVILYHGASVMCVDYELLQKNIYSFSIYIRT